VNKWNLQHMTNNLLIEDLAFPQCRLPCMNSNGRTLEHVSSGIPTAGTSPLVQDHPGSWEYPSSLRARPLNALSTTKLLRVQGAVTTPHILSANGRHCQVTDNGALPQAVAVRNMHYIYAPHVLAECCRSIIHCGTSQVNGA
jgi:hypothetical protein